MLRRFLAFAVLFFCVFSPVFSHADDLGKHILNSILAKKQPTDASLLLITRDLGWYEQNMGKLPVDIQNRIQNLRIEAAGKSAQRAAARLGEPEAIFGATGSWNPGRDMDMVYFGKNIEKARTQVDGAFEQVTAEILSRDGPGDEILRSAPGIAIPDRLSRETMSLVVSDVPDFGYKDLERAYMTAKEAFARGESREVVMKRLHQQIWEALGKNYEAHIASTAPDMYRGAGGQQWWSADYLENPQKMRTLIVNPATGTWELKPGGLPAVPEEIAERVGFAAFKGKGGVKFSKIASDYAMFFKHEEGGLSGTAKYVYRIWEDVDGAVITETMTQQDVRPFVVANRIAKDPKNAEKYLADAGMTQEGLRQSLSDMLYRWTEKQMLIDTEKLVNELASHLISAPSSSTDDLIGDLVAQARLKFDVNEMASGLDILRQAPGDAQKKLVAVLEARFGDSNAGKIAIKYIKKQMRLLADEGGELTLRILKMLKDMGRIQDEPYQRAVKSFQETGALPDDVAVTVKKARKEVMLISSAGMFDVVDDPQALDRLMEEWRKFNSGAIIQSPNKELALFRNEYRQLPESELRRGGWTGDELRIPGEIRKKLPGGPGTVLQLESRLGEKMAKTGLTIRQFQAKIYEIVFNPAYVQLGDPSSALGALDAFIGVATGLYMTHEILFNQTGLTPEDENLQLGNAWVTAIPVVGDFAQGIITGSEGVWEGDRGKVVEAGLWISIGVMGCVPGGQLPALVTGIMMATKPLAAGAYDARQAQKLVQAWVESGDWTASKPRKLTALVDRSGKAHAIAYRDLLTDAGNVPYRSELVKTWFQYDVTINDSIRTYAEQNIMPQYPALVQLRGALKSLFPNFNDKDWTDEFTAKIKMDALGAKGGKPLFGAYYAIRTKALDQTITYLKQWAEDEMRAKKDYEAEVQRLRDELLKLESELKVGSLIRHADESVEAYSRVVKNVWEQESLPLSKLRIYEHYVKTYGEVSGKLRRVSDLLHECSSPYTPASWYLTGYPEFDRKHVDNLLVNLENGRKGVIEHIEKLLKEMDQKNTRFDASDECHKKAFDVLAPFRYKVAFMEHLAAYFRQLADGASTWDSSYEAAKKRYAETRDQFTSTFKGASVAIVEETAFTNAFMTFVAAIPYGLASKEADMYRSSASDFEVRMKAAMKEYDMAGWRTGEGGKALETCLLVGLKIQITLSETQPEEGKDIQARASLESGTPPKDHYWYWKTAGGLKTASPAGPAISVKVESAGTLTAQLLDHFDVKKARVLAEASLPVTPKKGGGPTGVPGATPSDPKSQAEAKYRWLKESVAYLEAIKEFDRKSYNSFEKSVTSSIVREFVSKAPPRYDKEFKLPDGPDKALCGETFGDIRDRLIGYESECWSTLNAGCKTVGTREFTKTVDGKEMKFAESISSCDAPCGKAQSCSNVLKTHTGQLGYANSLQDYVNEKQLGCLGEAGAANGKHQRELDKKIKDLPESLPYKRYQEYAGLNDWKGYLAAVEKVKLEFGLSDPIPSPIVLPWSYSSPCGGKGAAVETAKLAVTLAAKPEKIAYKPGEIVNVTANVTGGKPPYTYTWTGDHAGDGQTVTRAATKPGSYALSVEVKDGAGARGVTSITLKYEGVTAVIEGLTNQIIYGTSLKLRAKTSVVFGETSAPAASPKDKVDPGDEEACRAWKACLVKAKTNPGTICSFSSRMDPDKCGDDTPATPQETSAYRVIWQSDKTLDFQPGTSYDGTTIVLFDRMGVIKIWAEIEKKTGDKVYERVGETDQQQVTVVPPKFKMTFNPEKGKGKVGQEVRVTIETDPKVQPEIINYEWNWPESSGRMEYEKNASVIGFVPKDPKPVKLLVGPKTVYDRVPIGGAILDEYTAEAFNVTVTGPRQMGPAPQIWKEKVGLVDVQREIAVFHNVFMRAEMAPDPEKKPLRYQWTVTPDGCTIGSDISQEITVNCSQTGSYQAKVTVKDRDGVELGSGSGAISVTISQNEITKAKDKKKEMEEKLAKARALEREGKFDEAIALVDEVTKTDPKHDEAKQLLAQLKKEKGDADKKIAGINADIDNAKFDEAERELKTLKGRCPQYPPLLAAEKKLAAEREKAQGKAGAELAKVSEAVKERDFKQALTLAGEVRKTTKLNQKQDAELAGLERTARDQEAKKERARQLLTSGEAKLKNYDYDGALTDLAGGLSASQDLWSAKDPEPARFAALKKEAETKAGKLKELLPLVQKAAEGKPVPPAEELKKALASADEAKVLQPTNERITNYKKLIEQRLAAGEKENEKIKAAKELRDKGEAAQKQGKIPEAISSFRESLKILPDPALEAHVKTLEARLAQDREKVETAKRLRAEGEALQGQGKTAEAVAKYRESLKYVPDARLEEHIKVLEAKLAGETAKIETAKKLRTEGEALQGQGKTAEAVAKYRESLKYVPDARLEEHIKVLEAKLAGETAKIETAKRLRAEGEALQSQGKTAEAVAKYRESLKYVPDAKLEEHIRVLEAQEAKQVGQRKAADQLWQEGTALFNQGRPGEALAKFKESLKYSSSPERVKVVQDLEGRKTQAERLRSEGASFQSQGKLREAAGKYRESLGYWPDPALADHIAKIEAEIKKQETQVVTQPPMSGSGGADGIWEVSFNNYRGKMELQRSGSSWSGRLWLDAHQRWEQLTNISYSSTGRLEFTRPISGATQRYSGALSGERLEGTFTQENSATKYAWWANRTQAGTDKPTVSDAANASFPLQVVRNVPNQNSSAFKQNVRKDLTVDAARFDKIPYSMHVSSHDLMITTPAKFCLAGDAGGTKGWRVDNFLLIEILDQRGNLTSSALAGLTETVRRNGNPIETIGRSSDSFNACEIDVTKLLPVGRPFRLRASAMDYGYVGFVSDVFIVSPKGTSGVVSQPPSPAPSAKGSVIFNNGNTGGVYNNPSRATTFTLRAPHVITLITNYHWNNGRGATPGTIALRGSDGRTYGSWRTSGSPGQGGVPNANWNAAPNVTLPAGTYTVIDSNPATWAQNSDSQGSGHTRVEGYPVSGGTVSTPAVTAGQAAASSSVTAELTNSSRENTHIFTENETFGPGNRLAPGEKRRVAVTMKSDGSVTFKAGRNGQVMATKTWRGNPGDSSRVPVVVFDESNPFDKLTVTTGLR